MRLLFLLLILFPANFSKHFILPSAYIRGVLVDYLTPAIYLTEVVLVLLLVMSFGRRIIERKFSKRCLSYLLWLAVFLPSLVFGRWAPISLFRFVEIALWSGFVFWVSNNIVWERDKRGLTKVLSFGVSWVSILAIAQFFTQRNIVGYYFLGEPTLYPSLGGVAHTSFFGKEVIRAYGTFPHPNILGGTLAVILPWLLGEGFYIPFALGVVALLVSFSRLAWAAFLLGFFMWLATQINTRRRLVFILFAVLAALVGIGAVSPSLTDLSVTRRIELLESAGEMFRTSPLSGIGLGLFTVKLPSFNIPSGPTLFLQPVHNIFALVAAESGIFALGSLAAIFIFAFYFSWRKRRALLLVSLFQLILLGSFDHYLYTLPQGLFLLSLTLGSIFSYLGSDGRPNLSCRSKSRSKVSSLGG